VSGLRWVTSRGRERIEHSPIVSQGQPLPETGILRVGLWDKWHKTDSS